MSKHNTKLRTNTGFGFAPLDTFSREYIDRYRQNNVPHTNLPEIVRQLLTKIDFNKIDSPILENIFSRNGANCMIIQPDTSHYGPKFGLCIPNISKVINYGSSDTFITKERAYNDLAITLKLGLLDLFPEQEDFLLNTFDSQIIANYLEHTDSHMPIEKKFQNFQQIEIEG